MEGVLVLALGRLGGSFNREAGYWRGGLDVDGNPKPPGRFFGRPQALQRLPLSRRDQRPYWRRVPLFAPIGRTAGLAALFRPGYEPEQSPVAVFPLPGG